MKEYRVVGLDISSTSTGVALSDGRLTTVKPKASNIPQRLDILLRETLAAIRAGGGADIAIIEAYSPGGFQGYVASRLGEAGGVVRWGLFQQGVAIVDTVQPSQLKLYATGKGNASKEEVWDAAVAVSSNHVTPQNDDEGDAYWLRQIGLARFEPSHDDLVARTDRQWSALRLVRWPKLPERLEAVPVR